jgi:hypothetical protein
LFASDPPSTRSEHPGGVLRIDIDFAKALDEWLNENKIVAPIERSLWKYVSDDLYPKAIQGADDCNRSICIISCLWPDDTDLPERRINDRPDDPEVGGTALIQYVTHRATVKVPEPIVSEICIDDPVRPVVRFVAHLQYDEKTSTWRRVDKAK